MKPYYEHAGITIYHGDCREILPSLTFDVMLTDPPYGISHPTDYATRGRGILAQTNDFSPVHGDDQVFDPLHLMTPAQTILWGANYYADRLIPVSGWLVWDKRVQQGVGVNDQADCELAWTNCVKGTRVFRHMWNGFWRDSEREESYHPTQKPVALMRWCLNLKWIVDGVVCDPYMGSGPVLVAAKALGRRAIGIEIEERYCEIAARRLDQSVLDFAAKRLSQEVLDFGGAE